MNWHDDLQMTVTVGGAGTLTLGVAVSGYQAFGAGDDGKTFAFGIKDGTAFETNQGVWNNAAKTLTRINFGESSTGSALSVSTSATVYVDLISTVLAQIGYGTNTVTGTDAATTCVANATYVVDMSAWATADRIYTMPAAPAVGDRVTIMVQLGNASFELIIKGNTSQTVNGGSAATEWSRLFITSETVTLRYVATNTWIVEYDGRIPMKGVMHLSTSATAETAATFTYPTAKSGVWTADTNIGSVCTIASDKITARRACTCTLSASSFPASTISLGKYYTIALELNAVSQPLYVHSIAAAAGSETRLGNRLYQAALDDYFRFQFRSEEGSRGLAGTAVQADSNSTMAITENL